MLGVLPPHQRLNRCTMYDVQSTMSQLFKPIKYAIIVRYLIGAEYVDKSAHQKAVTTKQYISYTLLSTNVRQRTLKYPAIFSPLGTMFVHESAERRVSWRQAVRAEVIAASVGVQVQRYQMFTWFVTVVCVAHEGFRQSDYRRRQSVFGYDTAKDRSGARVHRQ